MPQWRSCAVLTQDCTVAPNNSADPGLHQIIVLSQDCTVAPNKSADPGLQQIKLLTQGCTKQLCSGWQSPACRPSSLAGCAQVYQ
eukprot:scaffold7858_cov17-Tisochrysis_lutea.AAC.1